MFTRGKNFTMGFALGLGTGLVARELYPIVKEVSTPVARALIKAGVHIYQRSQEAVWNVVETVEDLVAEAQDDYEEKKVERLQKVSQKNQQEQNPHPLQ
jgi:hypothetical protein